MSSRRWSSERPMDTEPSAPRITTSVPRTAIRPLGAEDDQAVAPMAPSVSIRTKRRDRRLGLRNFNNTSPVRPQIRLQAAK